MKNKKPKEPSVDAKQFKRRLYAMALMVGNKKRLTGSQIFNFIVKLNNTIK